MVINNKLNYLQLHQECLVLLVLKKFNDNFTGIHTVQKLTIHVDEFIGISNSSATVFRSISKNGEPAKSLITDLQPDA